MTEYKPSQIKPIDWLFMIAVALLFDGVQAGITLFLAAFVITIGVGPLISSIIVTPFAFLTFLVWFKMKGMRFTRWTKVASFGSGVFIELTPLNSLPGWTASVVFTLISDRTEKLKALAPIPKTPLKTKNKI